MQPVSLHPHTAACQHVTVSQSIGGVKRMALYDHKPYQGLMAVTIELHASSRMQPS